MPHHISITDPDDPRLDDFRAIADPALLRTRGLFVAEGRLVVRRLLSEPSYRVRAVLVTAAAHGAVKDALARRPDTHAYVVPLALIARITGFHIHRGCLAIGERPDTPDAADLLVRRPRRLVVLEAVGNPDNVGGIFRNALAFGSGGVVLDPASADPLYRKAIRVSSGAALLVPYARARQWPAALRTIAAAGYGVVALTPAPDAADLEEAAGQWPADRPLALLLGAEGAGLSSAALACADLHVRIRIDTAVDSLNVAVAAGIALHAFR